MHNAIYIFAGQLGRDGGGVHHRELVNDLWKVDLGTGRSNRVELSGSSRISRRMYTCGFIISQFLFAIGGISVQGDCL